MVKRALLYNNRTLDFIAAYSATTGSNSRRGTSQLLNGDPDNPSFRYRNELDFNIQLANHVPHVSTTDFLKALKNFFGIKYRSEEHTSELQSRENLVCRLLLEKKNSDIG